MNDHEQQLEKYARLAVQTGVNIQQGQTLCIQAPLAAADLVRKIAEAAYLRGARHVEVDWSDDALSYLRFKHAPDEALAQYPAWKAKGKEEMAEQGAAFMSIYGPNPDLLKDIPAERVAAENKARRVASSKYRSYLMADHNCWSLFAYPTEAWACKVFPGVAVDEAVARLWEVIFQVTRVDQPDPIQAWKTHNAFLANTVQLLNARQYEQLTYRSASSGTQLTVRLPRNHVWHGGSAFSSSGNEFNPNMPTEEVFTMPHKDGVDGIVYSTKPLNYGGTLIRNFSLTFQEGKVVDFDAEEGMDTLKHLLDTDDGSRRLGEVALVPFESPISRMNHIFYNTLFDENASCHLALGEAYPTTIAGGTELSREELAARGANSSLTHEDFMIGTADLQIVGRMADGKEEAVFEAGNWAASFRGDRH